MAHVSLHRQAANLYAFAPHIRMCACAFICFLYVHPGFWYSDQTQLLSHFAFIAWNSWTSWDLPPTPNHSWYASLQTHKMTPDSSPMQKRVVIVFLLYVSLTLCLLFVPFLSFFEVMRYSVNWLLLNWLLVLAGCGIFYRNVLKYCSNYLPVTLVVHTINGLWLFRFITAYFSF